jgi:hypothetical protein
MRFQVADLFNHLSLSMFSDLRINKRITIHFVFLLFLLFEILFRMRNAHAQHFGWYKKAPNHKKMHGVASGLQYLSEFCKESQ